MLYPLLSGRLPTESESVGQTLKFIVTRAIPPLASLAPQTPPGLCRAVEQMLSFRRQDRPHLFSVREAFCPFIDLQTRSEDLISPLAVTVAAPRLSPRILTPPESQYLDNNGVSMAYQVFGDGLIHLVIIPGLMSHLDAHGEYPVACRFLSIVGSIARVSMLDKCGSGLSERLPGDVAPPLEERVDDVRAGLDAQKAKQCGLMGFSEGGPMRTSFADTHPERTLAVVLFGMRARFKRGEDVDALMSLLRSATPRGAAAWLVLLPTMDVVPVLPWVKEPALVVRRADDVVASASTISTPGQAPPFAGDRFTAGTTDRTS